MYVHTYAHMCIVSTFTDLHMFICTHTHKYHVRMYVHMYPTTTQKSHPICSYRTGRQFNSSPAQNIRTLSFCSTLLSCCTSTSTLSLTSCRSLSCCWRNWTNSLILLPWRHAHNMNSTKHIVIKHVWVGVKHTYMGQVCRGARRDHIHADSYTKQTLLKCHTAEGSIYVLTPDK